MDKLDLNIDNYNLEDILRLFHLKTNYDVNDLKKAKRVALKTHPDKSGLDMNVFIFFSKAYNILSKIYKLKNKTEKEVVNIDYDGTDLEEVNGNKELLANKLAELKDKNFNQWFNLMFEKSNGDSNKDGYGKWFKSSDGLSKVKANNKSEFDEIFKRKKKESRELILKKDIEEMTNNAGYSMLDKNETVYSSDIFSKLKYEDVKKAHMETVVPVTEQDFIEKKRFNSVEQYIKYRSATQGDVPNLSYSKVQMQKNKNSSDILNTKRAYNLLKEDENMKKKNESWWKNLRLLK